MDPIRVALLFGGRSPEHEISVTTAASIASAADPEQIALIPIYITRDGGWLRLADTDALAKLAGHVVRERELGAIPRREVLLSAARQGSLVPVNAGSGALGSGERVDVLFPALHGQGGEDGSVQGLARLADLPCVGSGILGSALGMDKVSMKRIARAEGVAIPEFVAFTREEYERDAPGLTRRILEQVPFPAFVKPSNAGSSVGITKVAAVADLPSAVRAASRFDYRIVVEQGIDARELEVALLGNDQPEASVVGEIIPDREFYDYEAKYLSEGSKAVIPAEISASTAETVQMIGKTMFRALDLAGMARADFLLERGTGTVYFNEVNTIPGFTPISMYPMLWEASGLPYRDLITRLVVLAIERQRQTRAATEAPLPTGDDADG